MQRLRAQNLRRGHVRHFLNFFPKSGVVASGCAQLRRSHADEAQLFLGRRQFRAQTHETELRGNARTLPSRSLLLDRSEPAQLSTSDLIERIFFDQLLGLHSFKSR